jgi:dipeptidase
MKKSKLILFLFIVFSPLIPAENSKACTNILVTKGASADGSTMISYVADSHTLYGFLSYIPSGVHQPGEMADIYEWDTGKFLGTVKQIPKTYSVAGLMNEYQVAMGETTFGGREELKDSTGIIDYGSMMFLGLQRAKTAREAIIIMTDLVAEYGYASEGESISVSDPQEVWIFEITGKGSGNKGAVWVAMRIPDGYMSAHANQSRIRNFPLNDNANCLYSKDVISFARSKGYFKGKDEDFSFADAYAPLTYANLRICEARVWNIFRRAAPSLKIPSDYVKGLDAKPIPLWVKPDRKLQAGDIMELMRDHFENTEFDLSKGIGAGPFNLPYRWRPLYWHSDGEKYLNERSISTQQTGFSFVTQSRSWLPDPIGGLLWFGVDDTYSTVYMPVYCGISKVPEPVAEGTGTFQKFSWDSAFWVFNAVSNLAYTRYSDIIKEIQKVQKELEGYFINIQPEVEKAALALYKQSPALAKDYLTEYSSKQVENTVKRWRSLWENLFVKYVDGNVKDELGNVKHPPYPENWYRLIVRESGEHFKVKKLKEEPDSDKEVTVKGYFHSFEELGSLAFEGAGDFPFDKERLLLLPGTDQCSKPVKCCLTPVTDKNGKFKIAVPEPPKDKCGTPSWFIRIPKDEKRPVFQDASED